MNVYTFRFRQDAQYIPSTPTLYESTVHANKHTHTDLLSDSAQEEKLQCSL